PPPEVWSAGKSPSGLAVEDFAVAAFKSNDVARNRLRTDRRIKLLLRQPGDEASFLDGADFQRPVQPERVDDRPRLPIAKVQPGKPLPLAFEPDAARKLPIECERRKRDRPAD